ncbi:MAG: ThuA domain-containing protein [Kiritimatiellaeota bacterium]|nr:ThuA domain-containing protein [Kiritimatiellota bacterium]
MSARKALVVWGGWAGHTPEECADLFAPWLESQGFDVVVSATLDAYADSDLMASLNLIVPIWTMGQISREQERGLLAAVRAGAGIAGWHGGMCDSFRNNTEYQWMTGGQWVAHPGGCVPEYEVHITDPNHPITRGVSDFTLRNTEQYYLHVDPSNRVLATTEFDIGDGVVMPYVWTRTWGEGRVFYAAFGHTHKDFDVPEAREIVQRGMLWAAR